MKEKSILFTPIDIGSITIPNRFVRSATHDFMATQQGTVTPRQVLLFKRLAQGEIGLIITGHTYVNPQGKASPFQIAIYDDSFIDGLRLITRAIHQYPSKIFLQLSHAGRQTKEKVCGQTPLAPSSVYEPTFKVMPQEMSAQDIQTVMDDFIQGSLRAQKAGFDGTQLHIAHGYLLSSFISPYTNRRKDDWGGSLSNRIRIIIQIVRGIKQRTGKKFPLIIKLNSTDLLPSGLHLDEAIEIAKTLEKEGIDGIEVSGGMSEAGKASVWKGPFSEEEEGYFVESASKIKSAVSIPVFGLGGLRSFVIMEKSIQDHKVDLISMSRPFIREPDLVKKFKGGVSQLSDCISCNKCFNPRGISCAQLKE
jgi:2,4-dienoyl-CoA reductase-like NADH-dependent reductase (Old Yellow Enzyme family)